MMNGNCLFLPLSRWRRLYSAIEPTGSEQKGKTGCCRSSMGGFFAVAILAEPFFSCAQQGGCERMGVGGNQHSRQSSS